MVSKCYESTEVDAELDNIHVPSGTMVGPPAIKLPKKLEYKKRLLQRCIHYFKSDSINSMYCMRISGTDP